MKLEIIKAQLESKLERSIRLVSLAVKCQIKQYGPSETSHRLVPQSKEINEAISNYNSSVEMVKGYGDIIDTEKYEKQFQNELNKLRVTN